MNYSRILPGHPGRLPLERYERSFFQFVIVLCIGLPFVKNFLKIPDSAVQAAIFAVLLVLFKMVDRLRDESQSLHGQWFEKIGDAYSESRKQLLASRKSVRATHIVRSPVLERDAPPEAGEFFKTMRSWPTKM